MNLADHILERMRAMAAQSAALARLTAEREAALDRTSRVAAPDCARVSLPSKAGEFDRGTVLAGHYHDQQQ